MTLPGRPQTRARLRLDAPDVYHLAHGAWYDVLGDGLTPALPDGRILVRPFDAMPDDAETYIPLAPSMVELCRGDGARILRNPDGTQWVAGMVPFDQDGVTTRWLRFVSSIGAYALVPSGRPNLDAFSDDELLTLLTDYQNQPIHAERPHGLRIEARVRPAFAWAYRMLDENVWYLVDSRWSTERALAIVTAEGERIVDVAHVRTRTFLD